MYKCVSNRENPNAEPPILLEKRAVHLPLLTNVQKWVQYFRNCAIYENG
jgi:hypothetical protein